jgi:hypothetical protein
VCAGKPLTAGTAGRHWATSGSIATVSAAWSCP